MTEKIQENEERTVAPEAPAEEPAATQAPEHDQLKDDLVAALKTVFDPEIPVNIVDLGLVYSSLITALEQGGNRLDIRMTMTAPGCGMGNVLKADVERKLSRLPDVREVHVEVLFDPPWHAGLMSEAARLQLGLDFADDGIPPTFPIIQGKS